MLEGFFHTKHKIKVIRNNEILHDDNIEALKSFKRYVHEVKKGEECGLLLKDFDTFEKGDRIECYYINKVPTKLGERAANAIRENKEKARKQRDAKL